MVVLVILVMAGMAGGYYWLTRSMEKASHFVELGRRYRCQPLKRKFNSSFAWRTLRIGRVNWQRCVDMAVLDQGLYLGVKQFLYPLPPILIPWSDIYEPEQTHLSWRVAVSVRIGRPEITRVTVFRDVFDEFFPYVKSSSE